MRAKLSFKGHHLFFSLYFGFHRPSYGVSSIVKGSGYLHHYLLDCDCKNPDFLVWVKNNFNGITKVIYETENGYHLLCDIHLSFRDMAKEIIKSPFVDINWFALGLKRGYWFLEFKPKNGKLVSALNLKNFNDLTFMRVERIA